MKISKNAIDDFWGWFSEIATQLASNSSDRQLLYELDKRIRGLNPKFSWELGPGRRKPWQLVISPNLSADLRAITVSIVSRAPKLSAWEFHAARQPKDWNYTFEFHRAGGEARNVDASKWSFLLLRFPAGGHEIVLVGKRVHGWTKDERWHAAAIVLESILGEEILLDRIERFELVDQLDPEFTGKERPIKLLREAVAGS